MGTLKFSKNLEEAIRRIQNIKKMGHGKGGLTIEVDYFEASYWLKDDNGKLFHPLVIIFVHGESHFLLGTHMVMPSEGFLMDFFDRFLEVLETGPMKIGKMLIKKQDLFDVLEKTANDLGIEVELAKRLPTAEFVRGDMTKFLSKTIGKEKMSQSKTSKKVSFKNVYQFKIMLEGSKPPIWRRIQVSENYSFWDLHMAIQDAMGWTNSHLHEFEMIGKYSRNAQGIGIPDPYDCDDDIKPGWKEKISKVFPEEKKMRYVYDFGDNWEHLITLEKILPRDAMVEYPICIAGKMACPFEDSGALWGYYEKLEILKNPKHPEYAGIIEWIGDENFDPVKFDLEDVYFTDPKESLEELLESQ